MYGKMLWISLLFLQLFSIFCYLFFEIFSVKFEVNFSKSNVYSTNTMVQINANMKKFRRHCYPLHRIPDRARVMAWISSPPGNLPRIFHHTLPSLRPGHSDTYSISCNHWWRVPKRCCPKRHLPTWWHLPWSELYSFSTSYELFYFLFSRACCCTTIQHNAPSRAKREWSEWFRGYIRTKEKRK